MISPNNKPEKTGLSGSNGRRTETSEQRFVRLLSRLETESDIDEETTRDDLLALAELHEAGFISAAEVIRDGKEVLIVNGASITSSGRCHLAYLKEKATSKTSIGFIKQHRFAFYKWFFAIVSAVVVGYVLWLLKLR